MPRLRRLGASGFVPKPIKGIKGVCRLIRTSWEHALDDALKKESGPGAAAELATRAEV